jgi:2-furoyl-CoA dehydrogenase FAD binding subunit
MKAAPFDYARPATVPEAVALLAETGDDAKVLAGGQSLVPVLAMRLGRPALLVDINAVAGLDALSLSGDTLYVGATVRQRQVERDPLSAAVPLLRMALPWIGHRELRSRGTVCGSLAHADPAAELPAIADCSRTWPRVSWPTRTRVRQRRTRCVSRTAFGLRRADHVPRPPPAPRPPPPGHAQRTKTPSQR